MGSLRKYGARLRALMFCLLAGTSGVSQSADPARWTITWAAIDFPPFQVVSGAFYGTGSFDGLRNLLVQEIGDARHELTTTSFAERENRFRAGERLCSPGMFRTPARERYLVFSRPALIHLDNRLVFLARNGGRFPPGDTVDINRVFADPQLKGGIIAGRSFAPNIDAAIRRHAGLPHLSLLAERPAQVLDRVLNGEIDYTVMFSHEASFLERQAGQSGQLANRSIEGTPPYILTHVACSRGEWGERVIKRVNQILGQQKGRPLLRELSARWYDAADQALIERYYPRLVEAQDDVSR